MIMGRTRSLLYAALIAVAVLHAPLASATDVRLQVGITGENRLEGLDDPVRVLKLPEVSVLFGDIADRPRTADYIRHALAGSPVDLERLVRLDLLVLRDGDYAINFTYLTTEDHDTLLRVLEPYAESLAQAYRDRWDAFLALLGRYDAGRVGPDEVAFVVLGAMSLDWDGLDVTADMGLRIPAGQLPGGRTFIIWARELAPGATLREMYWGSHNETVGRIRFTSFGDHHVSPRLALPDLAWRMECREEAPGVPRHLARALHEAAGPCLGDDFFRDVGAILQGLREGSATPGTLAPALGIDEGRVRTILEALEPLQYVDRTAAGWMLATPYLSAGDKVVVDALRDLSRQIIRDWLASHHTRLRSDLRGLTGLGYGVTYEQLFTEVWHYLFGLTNRALVHSRHFADPYAPDRLAKGIIPFAMDTALLDLRTEAGR